MRKRHLILVLFVLMLALTTHAQADIELNDLPVITADNAAQVTELATVNLRSVSQGLAWSPDNSQLAVATVFGVWLYSRDALDASPMIYGGA